MTPAQPPCYCHGRPTRCGRCALFEAARRRLAEKAAHEAASPGGWPQNTPRPPRG